MQAAPPPTDRRSGRSPAGRLVRWYGAGPLHLLVLLASFALTGYAGIRLLPADPVGISLWFLGAVVGHDLLLLPLYSIADRSARAVLSHLPRRDPPVGWINHIRVPAVLSGLLLLVWFPLILRLPPNYQAITGSSVEPFLGRWLLVTGLLFTGSAIALAVRYRHTSMPTDGRSGQGPP